MVVIVPFHKIGELIQIGYGIPEANVAAQGPFALSQKPPDKA